MNKIWLSLLIGAAYTLVKVAILSWTMRKGCTIR